LHLQTAVEEKVVIVVHIMPGSQRPYYLTAKGKEMGTYIRMSGKSLSYWKLQGVFASTCFDSG